MPPGPVIMDSSIGDGQYASKEGLSLSERAVKRLSAKYDCPRRRLSSSGGTDSNSSASSSGSVDTSELNEHERLQIESCFRGLKTQVCSHSYVTFFMIVFLKILLKNQFLYGQQ